MKELETEHSYQMRQNDAVHTLKMKDIHAGYCSAIEELKIKNEVLSISFQNDPKQWHSNIIQTQDHLRYTYTSI